MRSLINYYITYPRGPPRRVPTYPAALGPVPEVKRERRQGLLLLHRRRRLDGRIVVVVRSIRVPPPVAPDLLEGLAAEARVQAPPVADLAVALFFFFGERRPRERS